MRIALSLLLVPAAVAVAQPTPQEVAFGGASNPSTRTFMCGTNMISLGAGTKTASCTGAGATYTALGEAIGGVVRGYASTSLSSNVNTSNSRSTTGMGYWGDRIVFAQGSVLPAFVTMSLHFTGSASASLSAPPAAPGDNTSMTGVAQASWSFNAASTRMLANYNQALRLTVASNTNQGWPGSASGLVDDFQTFVLPVDPTLPLIDLWYSVTASASFIASGSLVGTSRTYTGSAVADMSRTGVISGVSFQNAAGATITSGVNYSFVNGAQIVPDAPAVTTPEPATVALLGAGLVASGSVVRRRRVGRGSVVV